MTLATVTGVAGSAAEAVEQAPGFVHYLPVLTTIISAAFLTVLVRRAVPRGWPPHLLWWGIGVFFYGVGTALESAITIFGNTQTLNRLWYWAGAILGGYPLATGTVYLVLKRKTAHILTAISLVVVIFASVCVLITPLKAEELEAHRPTGAVIGWQWVRLLTPFINIYAAIFLVGGALHSSVKFAFPGRKIVRGARCVSCKYDFVGLSQKGKCPECGAAYSLLDAPESEVETALGERHSKRAIGTALIAVGGILPGIGGSMAKGGIVEALYIGELAGMILIWAGYEMCIRDKAPKPEPVLEPTGDPQPA